MVLPSPQITDAELQEVVKLGKASAQAKELVAGNENGNDELLADYSTMTPQEMIKSTLQNRIKRTLDSFLRAY